MSRIRRLGVVAIMMVAMLIGGAPAFATEPLTTSGHVTDPDGFLSDEQHASITSRAESFNTAYDTTIDVVIIPNFSGQEPTKWCEATLKRSRTIERGILYVVAYEDGTDAYCTDAKMARSMQTDTSIRTEFETAMETARSRYTSTPVTPERTAAGAQAFIANLRSSFDFRAEQAARYRESQRKLAESKTKAEESNSTGILVGGVILVLVVGLNIWIRLRNELEPDEPAVEPAVTTPIVDPVRREALRAAAEAHRRLLEAEEQVRAAEEDWNFARAQFGSAAAEEYGRRLEAAKAAIARGFDTHKQIEQTPDSHAKRRLATTITEDLDKNLAPLRDARKEFAAQREKRSSLPTQLADARERLVEELADLERSKEELSSIAGLYTESMLASLQDNPQRAEQLLESARAALETAGAHIDTDATRAASALDTAQRALTMANAQTDAIFSAKTDLDAFRERLTASIGSVSAALSDIKQHDSSDAFSPLLDEAEAAITRGQRALVSDEDPLGALENLRDVEFRMDAILAQLMTQR